MRLSLFKKTKSAEITDDIYETLVKQREILIQENNYLEEELKKKDLEIQKLKQQLIKKGN